MAADDGSENWLVKARVARRQPPRGSLLPITSIVGSIRCSGPGCVGHFGRFGGTVTALPTPPRLRGRARFGSGGVCTFSGALALGASDTNAYACRDGDGNPKGEGSFHIELLRIVPVRR